MTRDEEKILKIAKEVVVKFIEIGRVSPTQFDGVFQSVFNTLKSSVSSNESKDQCRRNSTYSKVCPDIQIQSPLGHQHVAQLPFHPCSIRGDNSFYNRLSSPHAANSIQLPYLPLAGVKNPFTTASERQTDCQQNQKSSGYGKNISRGRCCWFSQPLPSTDIILSLRLLGERFPCG